MKNNMIVITMLMVVFSLSLFADNSFDKTMNKITAEYMKIKDTLTNDKKEMVNEDAKAILELTKTLDARDVMEEHKDHFIELPAKISMAAEKLSKAGDIKAMRVAFNDLSKPMAMWATMVKPVGINVAYCSMNPGSWLQKGEEIRNPYYGSSMLKCGEIVSIGADETEAHVCDDNCKHYDK